MIITNCTTGSTNKKRNFKKMISQLTETGNIY